MNSLDEDYVIEQVSRTALEVIPRAEHCAVYLLSEDESGLAPAVITDRDGSMSVCPRLGIEEVIMRAVVSKDIVYLPDVGPDLRYADAPLAEARTLLASPLLVDRRCIGTLSVDSSEQDAFEIGQYRLLSILANQAAAIIMKARLFKELNEM